MDLLIFKLGTTTGTAKGKLKGKLGHAWEATGGNGFGNFPAGNHYCDTLGRQREAMDLVTFGLGITTATRLGGNGSDGFGNFRAGNHYCDTLGRQREALDLVIFGLGTTTATHLGGNGRH